MSRPASRPADARGSRAARGSAAMVVVGVLTALAFMPAAPASHGRTAGATASPSGAGWDGTVTLVGDGSGADTGPQPAQPPVEKLKPGEKPPQFVVFSWDGPVEDDSHLFSQIRTVAKQNDARLTFFLRGVDLLPAAQRSLYQPPQHPPGTSTVPQLTDSQIGATLTQVGQAWQDGDEIGTAFNGQFCGPKGGADWSTAEWQSEIDQAYSFVGFWKTNTGLTDLPPLPFDYRNELVGGRAPCLADRRNLLPAEQSYGWRYDASSSSDAPAWPAQVDGRWDFPVQRVPYPGRSGGVLATDGDLLAVQSAGRTQGDPAQYPRWEQQARDAYLSGFERVYGGSRAPLVIETHVAAWNGGAYVRAAESVLSSVCRRDGVRCVSFRQLADWLDAQDPAVLSRLRSLGPDQPAPAH